VSGVVVLARSISLPNSIFTAVWIQHDDGWGMWQDGGLYDSYLDKVAAGEDDGGEPPWQGIDEWAYIPGAPRIGGKEYYEDE